MILFLFVSAFTWGQTWERIDNYEDVSPTGTYLIVDLKTSTALSNNNGAVSAPSAITITVVENVIEGLDDDILKWNISYDSSEQNFVFYPAGQTANWLYTTNTNNGVRIGTNTNKFFSKNSADNYNGFINDGTSRYVGVYLNGSTPQDWRCYGNTTGNIADTNIVLFELQEDNEPEPENVPVVSSETFSGLVGEEVSFQIQATENPSSFSFTGDLAEGLIFDTTTGIISGIPTEAIINSISVTATNSVGTSAPASINFEIGKGAQTATLNNVNAYLDAEDLTLPASTDQNLAITYVSDNTAVASVIGNVISFGTLGTATITASNAGNDNYNAFTTTFTVTVSDEPEAYDGQGTFVLVSSLSDLTDGYYVIANENSEFLMRNARSGSASTGFFLSEDLILEAGNVVNPSIDNVWLVQTNGSGKTIYNEAIAKYVGYTSGNSASIEDAPADTNRWTFTYADNKFTVNNVATSARQLSYNSGNPRFAAYGNANQEELQFYKLTEVVSNDAVWENGTWSTTPEITKNAVINSPLVIDGTNQVNFSANNLTVSSSGSLTINDGNTVTVVGKVSNLAGASNFVINSGANLIQTTNQTNEGEITVNRLGSPIKRLDYTMWSSPVVGQNVQGFSPETLPNRIYTYEGASQYVGTDVDADFQSGKGYLFRAPDTWSSTETSPYAGSFVGVPFADEVVVSTFADSFTSVGNPYSSNIDADLFLIQNSGVNSLYFWTNHNPYDGTEYTGINYAAYSFLGGTGTSGPENDEENVPSGIIAVGQGFIVSNENNSVTFTNDLRTDETASFLKISSIEKHRIWLNLNGENNKAYNQILVGYMTDATDGLDNKIDALMFDYEGNAIFSLINEEKFLIQGLSLPFETTDVIPVGFRAIEAGEYKISIANVDGVFEGASVYLKDIELGLIHDLATPYVFTSTIGEFNNRFEIVFEGEGEMSVSDLNKNEISIYTNQNEVIVASKSENLQSVEIYDLQGRLVSNNKSINAKSFNFNAKQFKSQILVVKAVTVDGKVISKKIIL